MTRAVVCAHGRKLTGGAKREEGRPAYVLVRLLWQAAVASATAHLRPRVLGVTRAAELAPIREGAPQRIVRVAPALAAHAAAAQATLARPVCEVGVRDGQPRNVMLVPADARRERPLQAFLSLQGFQGFLRQRDGRSWESGKLPGREGDRIRGRRRIGHAREGARRRDGGRLRCWARLLRRDRGGKEADRARRLASPCGRERFPRRRRH